MINSSRHFTNDQLIGELKNRLGPMIDSSQKNEFINLEEEVRRLSSFLQESERGKSQFLSNVRNEINNPLTSILGLASSITGSTTEEKVKRMSTLIYQQAFELDFQMRNIIVAAEIEMGDIQPMNSRVNIITLLEDQVSYLKPKIDSMGVTVKLQLPDLLKFRTDPYLLQTICANLLTNAIEYSGANKLVIVDVTERDEHLHLSVTDFGSGIELEKQKIIFDRFRQAETGRTKSHPGHGLGLTIVHELVELLQGTIELKSIAGKGTTIHIQIPPFLQREGSSSLSISGSELLFTEEEEF